MNCACYRFSLSMQSTQSQVSLPILFNDTARTLLIKLVDNGKPYYINNGCRAVFYAQKADGNILINDCVIEKNAKIRYDFTAQTASAEGISKCEIRLYGANGRLITSPKFIMVVDSRVVYDDQVIASYNEFTTLDAIIATEQQRVEAEKARVEAENARNERTDEVIAAWQDADRVFIASYGTTTCEEIFQELQNGKSIICRWGSSFYLLTAFTPNGAYFGGVNLSGNNVVITCEWRTNAWSNTITETINEEEFEEMLATSDKRFETLEGKVADLLYEAIAITAFSNNVNTAEIGSVIDTVAIAWTLSKTPEALTLDGEALDINSEGVSLSGLGLTADKTWTLAATDERDASASRNTFIKFLNGVYYGVLAEDAAIDSATVLTLTRKLQSGKTITFTVTAGSTQKIAFALPVRYGTPVFSVGGFEGGFELAATLDFENGSGFTEPYNIWLSSSTGLGNTTVSVK